MVRRKILSIEDLQSYFFSQDESRHFSSKDNGDTIFVQVPAKMSFDDDASEELMPVTLHSCHTGKNLNGSNIDKENMENAVKNPHSAFAMLIPSTDGNGKCSSKF